MDFWVICAEGMAMPDLNDGESIEMKGSGVRPYVLKNSGGVYSCSCPAWRNQSIAIERRTCKHLRKLRGDQLESDRVGQPEVAGSATATATAEAPAKDVPPLLLAERWDTAQDLAGWWMSEKLDGVRAYWDGKALISRLGNPFHAPDWFLADLPGVPLDGELWIGRKQFQQTVGVVRRQDRSDHWQAVTFVVFDAPAAAGPFEDRLAFLRAQFEDRQPPHARPLDQAVCQDLDQLRAELARVEALGGEGLMLRQPGSKYEVGRSLTLLKVKSFRDDEARVVDHLPGAGRHKGRLGALLVELADGTRFAVGTGLSDAQRGAPPPIGTLITFRYQELSQGGVPRFPSFIGVRIDAAGPSLPSPSVAPVGPPAPTPPGPSRRRFELVEGTAAKFWEVARDGCTVTVRYGRIDTDGQTKTKTLADEAKAETHVNELIRAKTAKGYVE